MPQGDLGAFASPDVIHRAPALPKTRSGKIAANEVDEESFGDTSTLADPGVVNELVESRPNK